MFGKMDAVTGHLHAPLSGVGKDQTQPQGQCLIRCGKDRGFSQQSFFCHPFAQGHRRRSHQQDAAGWQAP